MTESRELWWFGLLQGVLAILFGIAAIFWPGLTLVTLVYLFGAFILIWGLSDMVKGLTSVGKRNAWWLSVVLGLAGVVVGVYLIRHPETTFDVFILLSGFLLIVHGLLDMVGAFIERDTATSRTLWVLAGLAGIIAGIVLLSYPVAGSVAFVWVLGLYALLTGPLMIALSFDIRNGLENETASRKRKA